MSFFESDQGKAFTEIAESNGYSDLSLQRFECWGFFNKEVMPNKLPESLHKIFDDLFIEYRSQQLYDAQVIPEEVSRRFVEAISGSGLLVHDMRGIMVIVPPNGQRILEEMRSFDGNHRYVSMGFDVSDPRLNEYNPDPNIEITVLRPEAAEVFANAVRAIGPAIANAAKAFRDIVQGLNMNNIGIIDPGNESDSSETSDQ